jgi:exosome complex RNA-binding protein Csl4
MSVSTIVREIVAGDYTNEDLNKIGDAIRFARNQLTKQNRRSLVVGTNVQFTNTRTGQVVTGRVEKMALKFATVSTPAGRWKVPASMLTTLGE